jgi:flagellar protein FlaF
MAVSEIIGAAVGVLMLLITAYMLMGGVLYTADVVTSAQKDNTLLQETRLGTDFELTDAYWTSPELNRFTITFKINNTGTEPIHDFSQMDIIVSSTDGYQYLTSSTNCDEDNSWCITDNTKLLDPGDEMSITALSTIYNKIQVVTGNGVSRFAVPTLKT